MGVRGKMVSDSLLERIGTSIPLLISDPGGCWVHQGSRTNKSDLCGIPSV